MKFEEKLESIKPIRGISGIKAGKEWNQVAFYIKDKIVGRESYKKASEQKDALKVHVVEMLNQMNVLTYYQTSKVIERIFSEIFSEEKLVLASPSEISYQTDSNGKTDYSIGDEKVVICWYPSIECSEKQVILQYDDYVRLVKISKSEDGAVKSSKSSQFTFEQIVKDAFEKDTSDVHITFSEEYYNVFFKIYGRLERQTDYSMNIEDGQDFIKGIKIEAAPFTKGQFNPDVHYLAQDAKVEYPNIGINGCDVRLAFIPDGKLANMALTGRLLKKEKLVKANFGQMGYYEDLVEKVEMVSKRQNGLVISSGVTGSGKSTFVSNIVASIDQSKRVFTIEDPIEYFIPNPNVTQHQVYMPKEKDKQVGFKEYTKALKRGDPDIVNIGEMRNDPELIQAITEMSEAGQLVLTTVHITSAFSIYGSLEQVFKVAPEISVPLILFSINQVLVDKLCPHCKEEDTGNINLSRLKKIKDDLPYRYLTPLTSLFEEVESGNVSLYIKGKGCSSCNGKGYVGRVPIYEFFSPNVTFMEWLLENSSLPSRYAIEDKACTSGIGVNKLDTFCRRLKDGSIDASEGVVFKIM